MRIVSDSEQRTIEIGAGIARVLTRGDIVCLEGGLGAGKTVLTKGIAQGLGIDKAQIISPTFVLIREHQTKNKIPFYHFDLYRLKTTADILALDYEEYLDGQGITVIEWSDRLGKLMPREYLKIKMAVAGEKKRELEWTAQGRHYKKLWENIAVQVSVIAGSSQ